MIQPPYDIARFVTRMNVGGPARHVLFLARALGDEFRTLLATGSPERSEGELTDPAVPVVRLPFVRPVHPWRDTRAFRSTRKLLQRARPRIVDTHMAKAGAIGRLAALSIEPRPRTVHTFHGHVLQEYFSPPVQKIFTEVERRLAARTDVLVAVSPEIRDELLGMGVGKPDQFHVISLGFDPLPFLDVEAHSGLLRSKLGLAANTPLVGVLGRLVPIKDLETLLDAMLDLPQAHLAVIGDGELRGHLESKVRRAGMSDRVHFTGWVQDVPRVIADLDVVALTSRNEGTPLSLIEALASARPVVATDVGGVRSVVDHGETGLLAPAGDARRIAEHLNSLFADQKLRERMGHLGRDRVIQRYDPRRLVDQMRDLYASLLS